MSWTTVWSKRLLNNPLVEEAFELFLGWSFDATVEQNLEVGLASRYRNVGRTKDVITTLSRRLRDVDTVRPLIVMAKGGQRFADWRDCCRLWIGATEEPFRLFALNWLYREREDGRYLVRSDDVRPFVVEIWKSRRTGRTLNEYGIIRTARDMIRTATSLGMLEGDGAARTFSSLAMSDDTLLYYAQSLTQNELSDFSRLWHDRCANRRRGHKMSWTETTRLQYRRKGLRYSSDMLDAEWELIAPFCRRGPAAGAAAGDGAARGGRGDLLHRDDRLPVADAAEGVSTLFDGAAILLPLARHRHLGADQSYAADAGARGGGPRGQPKACPVAERGPG